MFRDNDIVCFLGDSITASGLYLAEVYQTLRKKYRIKCYNCGVSGGRTRDAVRYLHANCLIYNPDHVVIMFGINDIERWLLSEKHKNFPNREEYMRESMRKHAESYEEIIKEVHASGADAILCVTVPYDEVSDNPEENLHCQYLLDEATEHLLRLAEKYNCPVVDFKKTMQPMLGEGIINPDRVHPTEKGYHIMAQTFLYDMGEIEKCDFDSTFVFEDWNKERYDAEMKMHKMNYIEFCAIFDEGWAKGASLEERKALAREKYEEIENKTTFIPLAYLDYIENIEFRDKMRGEVVKRTIF